MYLREVGGRRSVVVYRTSEMFKRAHLEADEETKGEDSGDEISGENDQGEVLEEEADEDEEAAFCSGLKGAEEMECDDVEV